MGDLFEPIVDETRLSESFKTVARSPGYAPARAMMRDTYAAMGNRDGNFVEQFQTSGFDARISELYLFAALNAAGFEVQMPASAPDFLVYGHGFDWSIEATTANPSGGGPAAALPDDRAQLQKYIDGELVVRLGSALYSKLQKHYWELAHVSGKPLVLAIQNFASEHAQQLADTALIDYLYGLRTFGEFDEAGRLAIHNAEIAQHAGSKEIPSNFFATPDSENIAAVLWTNSGTIAKFARMGFQQGIDSGGIRMIRTGMRYVMNPDADAPAPFSYVVGVRWEPWEEGLVMAHNPRAALPLPEEAFPGIVHHELDPNGLIRSTIPPFHAFRSRTGIVVSRDGG